ncbi:trypsin-like peptidase domain-containing protein [Tenacibaculum sp. IB213877]|uniref:trypsin-like peptidase domain-containing protein n=1 Tax=Tenacibaculum sp. IB213877 TaxID=3097351 RepID=UPI002A599031|nr:trypsin-like peptidase domain-containing protein [Tenacibaculum sp. IB213877]MDY0779189.1 trypsin-like peptidase domain-containing protein [Tenacibaculum sp. IB213877]
MKKILGILGVAFLGGAMALGGYKLFFEQPIIVEQTSEPTLQTVKASYTPTVINSSSVPTNFTEAAEKTVHAVVHVKNTAIKEVYNPFEEFFGGNGRRKQQQVGTGSGVIISQDGYIITNNHVIDGATDLEITLNNRKKVKAELIGTDKSNDIALLKIDYDGELPYIPFGNSDNAKIGEWVLAVGNPYNLTSTVTAGIISAKGRDLDGNGITDAFIQTDAAVNPGNSGGALVNTRGELIGINTAITSRTGSYIGYSFAVPSNIAKKIIDDILEFGDVQEALMGIEYAPQEDQIQGVKISKVTTEGGAEKAGLQEGDIIKKVNNVNIEKFSDLRGQLTARRPGDKVAVTVLRDGENIEKVVTLGKKDYVEILELSLTLKDLTKSELKKHNIKSGAKIAKNLNPYLTHFGVKEGFIITKINKTIVVDALDAKRKLTAANRSNKPLFIEVINLSGQSERYAFNQ